ncbi:MAG: hypothetical protein ISQ06_02715 [Planctomycetaceae bacterium]|nr:hypothetical protein [Planctomycetaceae bacterium]
MREAFPVLVEEFKADMAAASPFLRELAGPVTVLVEREEGKRRATWLAASTINLVSVIAQLSAKRDFPTTRTRKFLETRRWTNQKCEGCGWIRSTIAELRLKPPQLSAERGRNDFWHVFLLSTVTNPYSRAISLLTSRF